MKKIIALLILLACLIAQAEEEKSYTAEKQGSSMWFLVTIPTDEVKNQFDWDYSEFSNRKSQYARQSKPNTNDYCHCKIICKRDFLTEQGKKKTTGGTVMTEAMKRTLLYYASGALESKDKIVRYNPGANVEMKMFISCKTDYREVTKIQIIRTKNTIIIYQNGDYEVKENSDD